MTRAEIAKSLRVTEPGLLVLLQAERGRYRAGASTARVCEGLNNRGLVALASGGLGSGRAYDITAKGREVLAKAKGLGL